MNFEQAFFDELVKIAAPVAYSDKYVSFTDEKPRYGFFTGDYTSPGILKAKPYMIEAIMSEKMLSNMGGSPEGMPPSEAARLRASANINSRAVSQALKSGKHSSIFTRTSPLSLLERTRYKFSKEDKRKAMLAKRKTETKNVTKAILDDIKQRAHKGPLRVGNTSIGYADVNAGD